MTDERSRYDGDPPPPPEPLVNTLPCDFCGERATHFSPHSKLPLCWLCAAHEEEGEMSVLLSTGTATDRDIYNLMERLRDRCYERAACAAAREREERPARRHCDRKRQWHETYDRVTDLELANLVHRVRCNVTLSPWRGADPIEELGRMLEE